jgi:thiol-disulfide isomerase/thioredoxin
MRFCYTIEKLVTVTCERQFTSRVSDLEMRLPNRVKQVVTAAFLCLAIAHSAVLADTAARANSAAIAAPVEQGATLLDATLQGLNGPARKLSEFRGRPLIINVWASWCGPCREEMASLERLAWRSESRYFAIIGISTDDDADRAKDLLKQINATISQFIDKDLRMESMLGASRLPLTVLIDGNGRVLEKIYGARQWDGSDALRLIDEAFHRPTRKQDSSRSSGTGLDIRGGRMAERQRENEARAAAAPIEAMDFSAMRLDDGTADRQP